MQDLLPERQEIYRHAEDTIRGVLARYGYREIGIPVLESTQLFERLVGENTDIVEKEMYTFEDRNGDSLSLRPEGTAGCVRAAKEKGIIFNQVQRLWYSGPMFRYERPQKGRYRQFEQLGVECFGMPGPDIDAELLLMTDRVWQELGLKDKVSLELNSLGSASSRNAYKKVLVEYLSAHQHELDVDSQRRLTTNPLRILDSKNEHTREITAGAPSFSDYLDEECKAHFKGLRKILDKVGLNYTVNEKIVRGLDYYNMTVFEWVTEELGAQGAVCAGGRYDGLVEVIGGKATPAIGFGIGIDRLALLLEEQEKPVKLASIDIFIASSGEEARVESLLLAEELRENEPAYNVVVHCGEGKFKSQLKKADASGALIAIILGEDEILKGEVSVKALRDESEQFTMSRNKIAEFLKSAIVKE